MRRLIVTAALGVALGCVGSGDQPSNVHDLRVLAMQADPPERYLADGIPYFKVRALIGDAPGVRRDKSFRFSTCPKPDRLRCEGLEQEVVLGEGTTTGELAEVELIAPTDEAFFKKAIEADAYRGFGGLPLLVALRVGADAEQVWGAKRLVLQLPPPLSVPGQAANLNPPEPVILLNEAPLPAASRVELRGAEISLDLAEPAPGAKETYLVPTFDGATRELVEAWQFSWFTTKGHFSPETTGGFNPLTQEDEPAKTKLVIPAGEEPGDLVIYVVVRDGRGGESWTKRAATWLGP